MTFRIKSLVLSLVLVSSSLVAFAPPVPDVGSANAHLLKLPFQLEPNGNGETGQALLLPDLLTLPPYDLKLAIQYGGTRKLLQFSNTIWNRGPGNLEVRGWLYTPENTVFVRQWVMRQDGTYLQRDLGQLNYHSKHEHWHWLGFSRYEIWSVDANGELLQVQGTSGKVGYCLRDDDRLTFHFLAGPAFNEKQVRLRPRYGGCDWRLQGISPGWSDTYDVHTEGQFLEITGLPDGIYALKSTVDPDERIVELDDTNNDATVYFGIFDIQLVTFGVAFPNASNLASFPLRGMNSAD